MTFSLLRLNFSQVVVVIYTCTIIFLESIIIPIKLLFPENAIIFDICKQVILYATFFLSILSNHSRILTNLFKGPSIVLIFGLVVSSVGYLIITPSIDNQLFFLIKQLLVFLIPTYFIIRALTNYDLLIKYAYSFSIILSISFLILLVSSPQTFLITAGQKYSQNLAYSILPSTLFSLLYIFIKRTDIIHIINLAFSLLLIFAFGARGPLFVILFSLILYYIFSHNIFKFRTFIILSLTSIFLLFSNSLISELTEIFKIFGLSTRTLDMISAGTFTMDGNRIILINKSINYIIDNPLYGTGVFNDRLFLNRFFSNYTETALGYYPHNIFIELFLQYGVILGLVFIFTLAYIIYNSLLTNYSKNHILLNYYFIGCGFIPLIFSFSYIQYPLFYLFLGFSINSKHAKNKELTL